MEYNYRPPDTNSFMGNYNDSVIIGNIIDIASLGFSNNDNEKLKFAGYYYVSDILGSSDIELRNRLNDDMLITSIFRIKAEFRTPSLGKKIFSNKVMNILYMGNIINLEQLMNVSYRYLYSIPNFSWTDMFEIIQRLDILFCLN